MLPTAPGPHDPNLPMENYEQAQGGHTRPPQDLTTLILTYGSVALEETEVGVGESTAELQVLQRNV
jgi:hypothetical protein